MRNLLRAAGLVFVLAGPAQADGGKIAPLDAEMGGQVYLCGLKAQLADATKGPKQKAIAEDAERCATKSREKIKALVKAEYSKYPESDPVRIRIKALYSAYLTYLDASMWGKDLNESKEALAFKDRVNEYRAEIELR